MRVAPVLHVLLITAGCAPRGAARLDAPPTAHSSGRYVLATGQRWADAEAVARAAGYRLHDASGLAMAGPGPDGEVGADGFYLQLPSDGDVDLIVFRSRSDNTVSALHLVGNASGPKALRTSPPIGDTFELPPPNGRGR